jgi:hypothetical protein
MNSDSLFESEFFYENKGLITICITVSLAMITIIYLYFNLKSNEAPRNTTNIQNNNSHNQANSQNNQSTQLTNNKKQVVKRRLTINAQDLLYKDLNDIDLSFVYQVIDNLAQAFDIYLIILVNENEDLDKITEKFSVLIEDNLLLKHVRK